MNSSVLNFIPVTGFVFVGQTICCPGVHFTATGWAARYRSGRAFLEIRLTNGLKSALPGVVFSVSAAMASTCPYLSATAACALLKAITSASIWTGALGPRFAR